MTSEKRLIIPTPNIVPAVVEKSIQQLIYDNSPAELIDVLSHCTNNEQKVAVFAKTLSALDKVTPYGLSLSEFHRAFGKVMELDDSPIEVGMTRGFSNVSQAITQLAEMPDDTDSGEVALYEDDEDLDTLATGDTGLGLAIRLCRKISVKQMEENLNYLDAQLGICDPQRMATYIRNASHGVFRTMNTIDEDGNRSSWIGESATILSDLISNAIERDEIENGFWGEVLSCLRQDGHFNDRGHLKNSNMSYVEQAMIYLSQHDDDIAEMVLGELWLEEQEFKTDDKFSLGDE
jgi:hypothetical protein